MYFISMLPTSSHANIASLHVKHDSRKFVPSHGCGEQSKAVVGSYGCLEPQRHWVKVDTKQDWQSGSLEVFNLCQNLYINSHSAMLFFFSVMETNHRHIHWINGSNAEWGNKIEEQVSPNSDMWNRSRQYKTQFYYLYLNQDHPSSKTHLNIKWTRFNNHKTQSYIFFCLLYKYKPVLQLSLTLCTVKYIH